MKSHRFPVPQFRIPNSEFRICEVPNSEFPSRRLTLCDIIAVSLIVLLCLGSWILSLRGGSGDTFTVKTDDGSTVYSLDEDAVFDVSSHGITLTVTVSDGSVCVSSSDCPDGICEATGKISRAGESIVCVPAQVVISVDSDTDNEKNEEEPNGEADFIVG